jgi:hypothetical protein
MVFLLMWLPGTRQVALTARRHSADQFPATPPQIEHSLDRYVNKEAYKLPATSHPKKGDRHEQVQSAYSLRLYHRISTTFVSNQMS